MCTLHLYKPSLRPVACCSMFLNIQVLTLLLGEYILHVQISTVPLPGYSNIFQHYLQHTYVCIHLQWDVRESFKVHEQFYNTQGQGRTDPTMKIDYAYHSLCACSIVTNASMSQGNIRETWASAFSLLVL